MWHQIILRNRVFIIALAIFFQSCSTTFYVVRHAEKSSMPAKDPELTTQGTKRAQHLSELLKEKQVKNIFSTQTVRTINTAKPLADLLSQNITIYDASNQSAFIEELKKNKNNSLIVGHSNTIRHIINGLAEKEVLIKDLEDQEYDNIFKIKRRKLGKPLYAVQKF
jgi:broad specificity phosphatase PhoE